ncbi:CdaR family protein [Dysosmobacter sp. HCP28S3_G4]|uniref:CdaR family protein n=1 Tax=Dysosmobacter sp. HCP28S3_G4 TaxID=3438938 RepID=UPI003F891332
MRNNQGDKANALYILISILVAIAIWIYVDSSGNGGSAYETTVSVENIPVEFYGEDTYLADKGLMLLDDTESTVSVEVSGSKTALMKLDVSAIRVRADVSDITSTGTQSISWRVIFPTSFDSSNVSYKPKKPSTYAVSVNVGELYRKSVDVRCDIQGAVAEGYIAGEVQCQPNVLELRGQQAEVEKISYAKVVLPIDNIKETTTQTLTYKLYDENDREVDSVNVHPVTDRIQVVLPVNVIKELPLVINFVEAPGSRVANLDYTIEPLSVTVSGDAALLRDVDSIVLEESFDLESFSGEATYNYQITLPDGCENLSGVTRATLKIRYKDLVTATVTTSRIEYENAPEGKTVTVLTSDLPVTLRGTSADVNAVTPEDVILLADLRDVSSASGSYTVPVEVRVDTNGDVGVVGTYQIRITISDIVEDEEPGIGDENDTDSNG